jgi:ATP-dependent RNA helicase UAP56/SUB2
MIVVQEACFTHSLNGEDIICEARAGTGKTSTFIITAINRLCHNMPFNEEISCIVIVHVRELVYGIWAEFQRFSRNIDKLRSQKVAGGEPITDQIELLKKDKPNILISTPGRLLALLKTEAINLDKCQMFILDECDMLLSQLGKTSK